MNSYKFSSVVAAFAAQLPQVTFPDGSPGALARGVFQIEKHVSLCSVVGLGESCEAAVDVGIQGNVSDKPSL